jgi:hypothetical protein
MSRMKEVEGGDVATKTYDGERWTQAEIDAVERAKEEQRRRELEASRQRDANAQSRQAEDRR